MMSGVLAAHEQTSDIKMASSTIRASFTCFDAARSIGRMASSKKHNTKTYQCQREKARERERERERGAGGRKSMGQARSSRSKNPKDMMGLFHCSPSKLTSNICRFLPWIPFAQIRSFKFQTSQQTFLAGAKAHRPHTA